MSMDHVCERPPTMKAARAVDLSEARREGTYPLERALAQRRSLREFSAAALHCDELAQLAWAAQGVVTRDGLRTSPSAGALFPLELYIGAGNVADVPSGMYGYEPSSHRLVPIAAGDRRRDIANAAWDQHWLAQAPAIIVVAAVEQRTIDKYGKRGVRYVYMEAGHAAQNVLLQATALGLGGTVVGAFSDAEVKFAAALSDNAQPLYLIPVGRPREPRPSLYAGPEQAPHGARY